MPELDPSRRAVVTGLGAVMPIGNDFPTYWSNLVAGVTGTRLIRSFDASAFEVRIAAEVLDFDPTTVMDAKMARRMTRFIHLGMGAAKEAVANSGIDFAAMTEDERDRVGVVMNTGGGGIEAIIDGTHVHDQKGPRFVSAFAVPALSGSMGAALLSMEWHLTGPVMTQVAACATSVIAFHDALRLIRTGECDVVLTGGSEAPVVPMGVAALANMGALSKRNDSPETASRPFDGTRDGFVLGEGAGLVVIESLAHALARGATPIAEVLGGALTADAFHISAPEPTGRADEVTDHRLRRADRDLPGMSPVGRLDRPCLGHVVEGCRRSVGDDVVDLVGGDVAVAERVRHRPGLAAAGRLGRADMEGIGGQGPSENLGDRRCATGES
ncbi:MAG TPA: beta-ketoacyl synthase N-terminal-like domain-containing protein, partial [Candidatus Limnocylindrales bacterium]|nr:beta-ketoacyl synthase N-terminal-like domain-containing protein [Candidatus Limnocylindrales bacterium]